MEGCDVRVAERQQSSSGSTWAETWQEHLSHPLSALAGTNPKAHKQPSRDSPLKCLPRGQAQNKPLEKQGCAEEGQTSPRPLGANPGRAQPHCLCKAGLMAAFSLALLRRGKADAGSLRAPCSSPHMDGWGFIAPSSHPSLVRQPVGDTTGAGGPKDARCG